MDLDFEGRIEWMEKHFPEILPKKYDSFMELWYDGKKSSPGDSLFCPAISLLTFNPNPCYPNTR